MDVLLILLQARINPFSSFIPAEEAVEVRCFLFQGILVFFFTFYSYLKRGNSVILVKPSRKKARLNRAVFNPKVITLVRM